MKKSRDWNAVDAHFRNSAGPMRDRRVRRVKHRPNSKNLIDRYLDNVFICDFCGEGANSVRRIAVDSDYERLNSEAKYACEVCSDEKERRRLSDAS